MKAANDDLTIEQLEAHLLTLGRAPPETDDTSQEALMNRLAGLAESLARKHECERMIKILRARRLQ